MIYQYFTQWIIIVAINIYYSGIIFFKHFNGRNLLVETYSQRNIFNRKNFNAIPPFPFFRDIMISDLLARPIVFDRKGNVALMKKNSFVYELPDALLYKYSFFITPNIR